MEGEYVQVFSVTVTAVPFIFIESKFTSVIVPLKVKLSFA